jgi:hypothetical protein
MSIQRALPLYRRSLGSWTEGEQKRDASIRRPSHRSNVFSAPSLCRAKLRGKFHRAVQDVAIRRRRTERHGRTPKNGILAIYTRATSFTDSVCKFTRLERRMLSCKDGFGEGYKKHTGECACIVSRACVPVSQREGLSALSIKMRQKRGRSM